MDKILWLSWLLFCGVIGITRSQEGYIWLMTDLHYDPTYWTTQESCNEAIPVEELGQFGDVECDAPWDLVEAAVHGMRDLNHHPDMIFWLGDSVHHPKEETLDEERVAELVKNCTRLLQEAFPTTQVYPLMGNHDYYPTSQLPGNGSPTYDETLELWEGWIHETAAQETFRRGSYYTMTAPNNPKLRILALNTNLYLEYNYEPQGNEQFVWMQQVLSDARKNDEKVQIITHVPTGFLETDIDVPWIHEEYNVKLNAIYREYGDVIVGLHSAHEHMDGFRIVYDHDGIPRTAQLIAPSVTPWRAMITPEIIKQARNPALRAIRYDTTTLTMIDVEQYYVNLTRANLEGTAEWELEYTFYEAYGMTEVTAESMNDLLQEMMYPLPQPLDSDHVFDKYYAYNSVLVDHPESVPENCSCQCKAMHICSMRYVEFDDYHTCLQVYNF